MSETPIVEPVEATPGEELLNLVGRLVNPTGEMTDRDRRGLGNMMAFARQMQAATQPPPDTAILDEGGFAILDEEGRPILAD